MVKQWQFQNKRRPGAYINFVSDPSHQPANNSGISVFILENKWGDEDKFVRVDYRTDFTQLVGLSLEEILPVRETLKASDTMLVYLPKYEGSEKASNETGDLKVTATKRGSLGNELAVIVNIQTDSTATVTTTYRNRIVDIQSGLTNLPEGNGFVTFEGSMPLSDVTLQLAGGTDGTLTNNVALEFLAGLDQQEFTHIALGNVDQTVKELAVDKVNELRSLGNPVFLVTSNFAGDNEAVISVSNGVTLKDGTVLTNDDAVYWIAAAQAVAGTRSLTYAEYPDAIDVERKSNDEIIVLLNQGHIVFTYHNGDVVIEQDINTSTSFDGDKSSDWSKNKIMRTMAVIEREIRELFKKQFIGKMHNNLDGRENFKASLITLILDPLADNNAIQYDASTIEVVEGSSKEAIVVNLPIYIVDAMEKLYMTVLVS